MASPVRAQPFQALGGFGYFGAFVVLVGTFACDPADRPEGELVHDSERLRLYAGPGTRYCGGTGAYIERFFDGVEDRYRRQPETPVEYFLLDELDAWCDQRVGIIGCAEPGRVIATMAPFTHGVAHAMHGATPRAVVHEGWAELLDNGMPPFVPGGHSAEAVRVDGPSLPGELYGSASVWLRYVDADFGPTVVRRLLLESDAHGGYADFADLFAELSGVDLDSYTALVDGESCDPAASSLVLPTCAGPEGHPLEAEPLVWEVDAVCADETAIGPWRDEFWLERVVEVQGEGVRVAMEVDLPQGGVATLERCGDCESYVGYTFELDTQTERLMRPGRWYLRVRAPMGGPMRARVELRVLE